MSLGLLWLETMLAAHVGPLCVCPVVAQWVGSEPTAMRPDAFTLKSPSVDAHGPPPKAEDDGEPNHQAAVPKPAPLSGLTLHATLGGGACITTREGHTDNSWLCWALACPCARVPGDEHEVDHTPAHPMPFNPFMITGSLVMCSLLGRGHMLKRQRLFTDSASRFSHLLGGIQVRGGSVRMCLPQARSSQHTPLHQLGSHVSQQVQVLDAHDAGAQSLAGSSAIGFHKPTFLSLKQNGKKVR